MNKKCILLFNKPFGVLSQFTDADNRQTLADFISLKNVYAAGRLDKDSEGLLLLTDNNKLKHKIMHPDNKVSKTYWVQVEGQPSNSALESLAVGVELKDGMTKPAKVKEIDEPNGLWNRIPPIRYRANIPTQWLAITISEGRNRQVRRMTAAIGHPTLRLIRYRIGSWTLDNIQPGGYVEVETR